MHDIHQALAVRHQAAQELARAYYFQRGYVPLAVQEMLQATSSLAAFKKYNPDQPRAPAGSPNGGQWVGDGGIGSGGVVPRPRTIDEINDPPLIPVYPVEFVLQGLTVRSAASLVRAMIGLGRNLLVDEKLLRAQKSIEEYLGGKPDKAIRNRAGDILIMRGNKKIRFDINNTHGDEPHFHIETAPARRGKWPNSGESHRYYFKAKE